MYTNIINSLDFTKGSAHPSHEQFLDKQVEQLYRNVTVALTASSVISIFAIGLLWERVPYIQLIIWVLLLFAVTVIRYFFAQRYISTAYKNNNVNTWYRWFLVGIATSGFLWGAFIVIAAQQTNSLVFELSILLVAGLCAGAAVSASASLAAYFAFVAPAVLPGTVYLFATGNQPQIFLGACLLTFFIFLSILETKIHEMAVQDMNLQDANSQLTSCLKDTFDRSTDGVIVIDAESKSIVDANKQALNILGYDLNKLIGSSYAKILKSNDENLENLFNCILEKHTGVLPEQKLTLGSSDIINLDLSASVIDGGKRELIVVVLHKHSKGAEDIVNAVEGHKNLKLSSNVVKELETQDNIQRAHIDKLRVNFDAALSKILLGVYNLDKIIDVNDIEVTSNLNTIIASTKSAREIVDEVFERTHHIH